MNFAPPPQPTISAPRRHLRLLVLVGAGAALFFAGLGIGTSAGQASAPARQPQVAGIHPQARTVTVTAYITPTTTPVTAPVAALQPAGPPTVFSDGVYEVGIDIQPGKYKTPGDGLCYWERAKNDSGELGSIIANDNVNGPTVVTLKAGEIFKSKRCGAWTKS